MNSLFPPFPSYLNPFSIPWDWIYGQLGIRDFVYFISAPSVQDAIWPVQLIFVGFTLFFFFAVMWFYVNSSYIKYKFLEDTVEFFSSEAYGLRDVGRKLKAIESRIGSGSENEYKLAIVEADDLLFQVMKKRGYKGDTFEELISGVSEKIISNFDDVIAAHETRNSIVRDINFRIEVQEAKKIFTEYETAIKSISIS
jgi:hypothetical protein